jgi:hypothetical protein
MSGFLVPTSSSGTGTLATYVSLDSTNDAKPWSTGNNATFLAAGTIAGTFTKQNKTSPLNGSSSYSYTMAAGSLNDWFASSLQPVPLRARGNTNRCKLVYTYNGNDNDIKAVIYDATNSAILSSQTAYIKTSSVGKQFEILFDVPATCVNIRVGFHVLVANSGKVLKFDDIQVSDEAFSVAYLVVQESITYTGYSSGLNPIVFSTVQTNKSGNVISKTSNSRVTFLKSGNFQAVVGGGNSSTLPIFRIQLYNSSGVVKYYLEGRASNGAKSSAPIVGNAEAGDYLEVQVDSSTGLGAELVFSITATAVSENIIQSWQDGTEWTSYTPTFSAAFGTVTNAAGKWKRSGSDLEVFVSCTTGTVAGSLATVSLPSGLSIDATKLTINNTTSNPGNLVGTYNSSGAAAGLIGNVIVSPSTSTSLLYFGCADSGATSHLTATNGTAVVGNSTVFSFYAKVPIQGWSSAPTLLALPTSKDNNKTYDKSLVTVLSGGTGWETSFAKFYPYRTISKTTGLPVWRMAFNVQGTLSVGATNNTLYFSGVTFAATPNQAVSGNGGGAISVIGAVNPNVSYLTVYANTSITNWMVSGDVELASKPTWCDEWIEPGVFVGQLSGVWQYDISALVTSNPAVSSMAKAVAVITKCDSGQYRMKFNISYSVASAARTGVTCTISGATFSFTQAVTGLNYGGAMTTGVEATGGASTLIYYHSSATTTAYSFSGDVELSSRPTWAVNTP